MVSSGAEGTERYERGGHRPKAWKDMSVSIHDLADSAILSEEAVAKLLSYHIGTVEAFVARGQERQGLLGISQLLGLTEAETACALAEARQLVAGFDPTPSVRSVARGALHPSLRRR